MVLEASKKYCRQTVVSGVTQSSGGADGGRGGSCRSGGGGVVVACVRDGLIVLPDLYLP